MIGIVFGCFIPLHEGHKKLIDRALSECDKVIIAVCGYDDDRGKDYIPFKDRIKLMKKKYQDYSKVTVVSVDDKKIGLTGKFDEESWRIWGNELFKQIKIDPNCGQVFVWYMGEKSYKNKLLKIYPKHHSFIVVERDGTSGTKIRKDSYKYTKTIDPDFLNYLNKHNKIETKKTKAKNLKINEYCGFIDDMTDNLLDTYQAKDWGVSYEEFLRSAQQELNNYFEKEL